MQAHKNQTDATRTLDYKRRATGPIWRPGVYRLLMVSFMGMVLVGIGLGALGYALAWPPRVLGLGAGLVLGAWVGLMVVAVVYLVSGLKFLAKHDRRPTNADDVQRKV